jgi:hypothetical protein
MFNFSAINYGDKIISLIIAVAQAVIIAVITKMVLDKAFQEQRTIGKNLQEYGIKKVKSEKSGGTLNKSGCDIVFGLNGKPIPLQLDLCFITGNSFMLDFQTRTNYIKRLIENGCQVRILLANPFRGNFAEYSVADYENENKLDATIDYYYKLLNNEIASQSFLERAYMMLIRPNVTRSGGSIDKAKLKEYLSIETDKCKVSIHNGDHGYQVKFIKDMCDELKQYGANGGSIELRFYEDEYQMPIIMATSHMHCNQNHNEEMIYLWTNINAPIRETKDSINVFCSASIDDKESATFLNDVSKSFDYLWNLYKDSNQ